jgi:hypothetical protein
MTVTPSHRNYGTSGLVAPPRLVIRVFVEAGLLYAQKAGMSSEKDQ